MTRASALVAVLRELLHDDGGSLGAQSPRDMLRTVRDFVDAEVLPAALGCEVVSAGVDADLRGDAAVVRGSVLYPAVRARRANRRSY